MLANFVYEAHLHMSQQVWLVQFSMTSLADVLLFNWQADAAQSADRFSLAACCPALLHPALPCYTLPC